MKFSLVRCFGSAASLNGPPLGGAEDPAVEGESGLHKAHKLLFSSGCTGWQEAAIFFIVRDLRDVLTWSWCTQSLCGAQQFVKGILGLAVVFPELYHRSLMPGSFCLFLALSLGSQVWDQPCVSSTVPSSIYCKRLCVIRIARSAVACEIQDLSFSFPLVCYQHHAQVLCLGLHFRPYT